MDHSAAAAEFVAEYNSLLLSNYCANVAAVVFIYEYFITIGEEAKYFWNRKLTGASALFFLNRYVPLTFDLASYNDANPRARANLAEVAKFLFVYRLLQYVFWAAFAGSRAFALTNRNWIMLLLVCGLSLVPVVVNLLPEHYGITGEILPLAGCVYDDFTPLDVAKCIIVADSLLILITWFSLFGKGTFHFTFGAATFAEVLLRDGTIYFIVLVVLNALHLAFSLASFAVVALQNVSNITHFTDPLTAILVQRFLLHLQSANSRALDLTRLTSEALSPRSFSIEPSDL
ncbi:hypothetical protein LXA43DRAFT_1103123 [Ganoderma leucocontextum]|nr:hypothetical protein LXA43DRAFT_1103123 [Ganoderma leucocontextum]